MTFGVDDIKKYIDESEHLTSYEQGAWQQLADNVNWNNTSYKRCSRSTAIVAYEIK